MSSWPLSSWPVLIAGLFVLLAYANSLAAGFVLDSSVLILEDPRIRALTGGNLREILARSYWWPYTSADNLYRPLTTLSYLFNFAILGNADRPAGYHLVNMAIHLANAGLLYALVLRVSRRFWLALFAAGVWAVHPLTTEAVTNIVGRADLLAAFGVLGALYAYVRAAETPGRRGVWLFAAAAATFVGVFSKESAVTVLGVVIAYDLLVRWPRPAFGRLIAGWIVIALPIVLFWFQRSQVLGSAPDADTLFVDNPIVDATGVTGVLTAFGVLGRYIWLAIWPGPLSADYSFAQIPLASGTGGEIAAWLTIAIAVALTVLALSRNRLAAFAAAAAWITVLPASNLLFTTGTVMAERLVYLPLAGMVALGVGGVLLLDRVSPVRYTAVIALSVIVVALGLRTFVRNADWRTDATLWAATAAASPESFKGHAALADALYASDPQHANLNRVVESSERSVAILDRAPADERPWAVYRQAAVYALEYGDQLAERAGGPAVPEAQAVYDKAAAFARGHLAAVDSTPSAMVTPGTRQERAEGLGLLTTALLRLGRRGEAIDAARQALTLQPDDSRAYRVLAAALIEDSQFDAAAVALLTGVTITGDQSLRQSVIELYRGGLDTSGCAISTAPNQPTLNSSCPIVRQHLCAAATEAIRIHTERGRQDLVADVQRLAATVFGCGGASPTPAANVSR